MNTLEEKAGAFFSGTHYSSLASSLDKSDIWDLVKHTSIISLSHLILKLGCNVVVFASEEHSSLALKSVN
jgi:hypothetical protein